MIVQIGMHCDPSRGGADRYFYELLQGLREQGQQFVAAAFGPEGAHPPLAQNLMDSSSPLPSRLMVLRRFAAGARPGSPRVIGWHFSLYGLAACGPLAGVPRVAHFHGPWGDEAAASGEMTLVAAIKSGVDRLALSRADRIVVLSNAFKTLAIRLAGNRPNKVRVVPPGVDTDRFHPMQKAEARTLMGWDPHEKIILCVRRMIPRMGLENLIDAWGGIGRPAGRLIIAGSGPLKPALEARAATAGNIAFAGRIPDANLPAAYAAADLTIIPSLSLEGFGLVAVESLACGTPSLVSPVGGLPEAVAALDPGLVLPDSGPGGLNHALRAFLDGKLSLPDPTACRDFVSRHYTRRAFCDRVMDVYREVSSCAQ